MDNCKHCGAALLGDEEKCEFCGTSIKRKKSSSIETVNSDNVVGDFSEYHETICQELDEKENKSVKPIPVWMVVVPFIVFFVLSLVMMICFIAFL